jgi:hypothetical protein
MTPTANRDVAVGVPPREEHRGPSPNEQGALLDEFFFMTYVRVARGVAIRPAPETESGR